MQVSTATTKLSLPYYEILECLGDSLNATVYKAFLKNNPKTILIIKVLKRAIDDNQRNYLEQKIERLKIIQHPSVITPISFDTYHHQQFIVRDFFVGQTLESLLLNKNTQFSLEEFFDIAAQLVLAVNAVHEAGIIHGGIKPNNILVNPKTNEIKLIDFLNPIDIQEISHFIYDKNFVEGTLAYTSPEQTGRINHRIEFSTDIYSLGIIFYRLLTGKLPFRTVDPLELIHSHLAEEAIPIHYIQAHIPTMLESIVAKMCFKEPEKRYQTGMGLYADLQHCAEQYKHYNKVNNFSLGLADHTRRIVFISKMVGRDKEAKIILDEYAQVTTKNQFHTAFISGLPGIGKTRLIQELQRPLVENKGYFTAGKFDQYQKNIPYSSLIQALRNLIRTFLTESDQRVEQWRTHILSVLGNQAKVITDVIPELVILLGEQPAVHLLPPVESRNRFNNLFADFLAAISLEEHPLVLFIDDLQWCDSATFDFLQHLFANSDDFPYLFFIGAYRNNEVDKHHPLMFLLQEIKKQNIACKEVYIGCLEQRACYEMVAYILDLPIQQTEQIADFLETLTEGNPLFVSESLSWLHSEGLLQFSEQGEWIWDMDKIRHSNMPTSVVDMFGVKVEQLGEQTLDIIKLCACMGNRFNVEDIILIKQLKLKTLFELLKPVLKLGLLIESKTEFQFVHDRVQEAVLRLISTEQRQAIHWQVGQHLLAHLKLDSSLEQQDKLFTIAAHLNLGSHKMVADNDHAQCLKLAYINLYAGNKALNTLATSAANEYYHQGLDLLSTNDWQDNYELMYRLHQKLAKTELMSGRYEQSEILLNQLLERAKSDLDRAEALAEQTTSLSSIGNFIKAIDIANKGLNYFDKAIPMDSHVAKKSLTTLMNLIQDDYHNIWQTILKMPFTEHRKNKIELAFYSELIPDLYMSGLVSQLYLAAAQSTLHCLQGGMDESVIYSFSIMGLNLGEQGKFEQAFHYQDLAHDLCAKYPDTFGATRGMNGIVWCNMHSRSHPKEIIEYCRKGIQCGNNCGDLYNAGLTYGPLMWNLQVYGHDFNMLETTIQECLDFSNKNQLFFSVGLAEAVKAAWIEPMRTEKNKINGSMQATLALWKSKNHVASAGSYYVLLAMSHYYYGRYQQADECLDAVEEFLTGMTDNVLKRQWYAFKILNALRYQHESTANKSTLESTLAPLLEQLKIWANLGPLLKPYLALCEAEWLRCFGGTSEKIFMAYITAIESASQQDYLFLNGYLNEIFAEWLLQEHWSSYQHYLKLSTCLYQKCGYKGKEIQLIEKYPLILKDKAKDISHNLGNADFTEKLVLPDLDIDYLVKSSLALSAEIDPDKLFSKIMTVVLECSSAQYGYLLQKIDDNWFCMKNNHTKQQNTDDLQLPPQALEDMDNICQGIVHYVSRTETPVVLTDALESTEFKNLPEINALSIRSLLCVPIMRQADLIGILYLENRLTPNVFTPERVHMIELLSLQAAIAIENSRLITEIGQFNEQLERRVEDITQKNREKDHLLIQQSKLATMGEMINNIAHQWRQPLNALGLLLGNLQDAQQFDELTTDYLNKQLENGFSYIDKMSNTINDFRDFFSPNKVCDVFKVADAVEEAIKLVQVSFKAHSIAILTELPTDILIYGILNEYSQVVLNLLTNAKEAILAHDSTGSIEIKLFIEQNKVLLTVQDSGGGINDNEVLENMFKPYYSTKEGGTGIGLYMSRMIIEGSMNGQIEISNKQQGAEFLISVPILSSNPDYLKLNKTNKE